MSKPAMEHNIAWVNRRIDVHLQAQGVTAQWILRDVGRVLGNALVELTWPREPGSRLPHKSGFWSKKEGKRAIEADLLKLFAPLDEPEVIRWMDEQFGEKGRTAGGRVKSAEGRGRIQAMLPSATFNWSGDEGKMRAFYFSHRRRDGRVRYKAGTAQVGPFRFSDKQYVPGPAFRRFAKLRQKHVGQLKAGFVPAVDYFSQTVAGRAVVPTYLRNVPQKGSHVDAATPSGDGFIVLHDQVPYAARLVNLIINTAQARTEAYMDKVTPEQMNRIVARFNSQKAGAGTLRPA